MIAVVLSALAAAATINPFAPPLGERPAVAGERTQFLNLGSAHLSEFKSMRPDMLDPLLTRLERFAPTVITIENLSGEQCAMLRNSPRYADAVKSYCWDAAPAQKLVGLTQQQAEIEADKTLAKWAAAKTSPTVADRRRLALLFLAADERGSAWVQWLRLAPAERIAADGIDAAMLDVLNRKGRPMNESYDVAAQLAARLKLDRIYAVDDHSSDGPMDGAGKEFEQAMQAHFAGFKDHPLIAQYQGEASKVTDGATMLGFYRYMNEPSRMNAQIQGDFGGAFSNKAHGHYTRRYGAWWETRNMRMLANIRAATINAPGARVLSVVGASHKPWYDGWMRQWADAEVVQVEPYLR